MAGEKMWPGRGRMKEDWEVITKAQDGSLDADIDNMLDEVKFPRDKQYNLKHEDKRVILRGLALRDSTTQILADVNKIRGERAADPIKSSQLQLYQYKRHYGEAIERLYNRYAVDIHRIYPFSDKFVRIKQLDALASRFSEYIADTKKLSPDTRKNISLFLRVLRALHEEMGITKYVVTRDVSKGKEDSPLDGIKDPEKAIEKLLEQRYGKQLGIENVESAVITEDVSMQEENNGKD